LSPVLSYRYRWIKPKPHSKEQSRVDRIEGGKSSNAYGDLRYKGTIWFHWKNAKLHGRYGCWHFGKSFVVNRAGDYIPEDKSVGRSFFVYYLINIYLFF
jgi:hypothetical protein